MSRRSQLIGTILAVLFSIGCGFLSGITSDQEKATEETGTAEAFRNSPEAITLRNFESWAPVPYRNVKAQQLTNDNAFATVGITAEFRDTIDSPWLESEATVECQKVGDMWRCDRSFNFQRTASSQATFTAQEAATQASIAQEAEIRLTQQAEYDEKCNFPEIKSEEESIIHLLEIEFWPEYDRPSMLVIYHVTLSSQIPLPVELTFRIPAIAGEPNAVATRDSNGALVNLGYSRTVQGEWADISFTTSSMVIQLEYYDPNLEIVNNSRHFEYQWQDDYAVDNLFIKVQQPIKAREMQISPEMVGPGLFSGMYYYCTHLGATINQDDVLITIDYEMDDTP